MNSTQKIVVAPPVTPQPGQRVELVRTPDAFTALLPGSRGTVVSVDSLGTAHISWDDGSRLGLVPGEDRWTMVGGAA